MTLFSPFSVRLLNRECILPFDDFMEFPFQFAGDPFYFSWNLGFGYCMVVE